MKRYILKNRFTLLLTVLVAYMVVLVTEGAITGRKAQFVDFENPFFDLNVNNIEALMNRGESRDDVRVNVRENFR